MTTLANQCPRGNAQDNSEGPMQLVIHGPTWTNRMPYDAHAMTVVVPNLVKVGWEFEANERFNCFDLFWPVIGEDAP
jgi:hypothetical protein